MYYTGNYSCKIDGKGRISIPSVMREELRRVSSKELLYICSYSELSYRYLLVVDESYREELCGQKRLIDLGKPSGRDYESYLWLEGMIEGLKYSRIDDTGRIKISAEQMESVGLKEGVEFVGSGTHMRVFDENTYKKYKKAREGYLRDIGMYDWSVGRGELDE